MTNLPYSVSLSTEFTRSHRRVIHRYLSGDEHLRGEDWTSLIEAMNVLRWARIIQGGQAETFAAIYDRVIDAVHSDSFIERLLRLADPESESEPLRASVSRRILTDLRQAGLTQAGIPDLQLLVAFCLYWWQAFARGYAFEVTICHDLTASQIVYTTHDLRDRPARLSEHDLEIMGFRGDVKTSTYFALLYRSARLSLDFYITRMYHAEKRRWHRAVWLKPPVWHVLNGEPISTLYDSIWQVLPATAQISLRGQTFVIVLYEDWKRRVLARQSKEVQ
jgi:hypothetical protein